jgi:epoxyqueuosine reductase QueG
MSSDSSVFRQQILALGATLVGFADMEGVLEGEFARWPRAVSIAVVLPDDVIDSVVEGPTPQYYDTYNKANEQLNRIAAQTAELIRTLGYQAAPIPATADDQEFLAQNLGAFFQHKTAATRAGLGWVGKSALLISYEHGPRVRLATVFTDMPLEVGTPVAESECKRCIACVRACPGEAISGEDWQPGRTREDFFDAYACYVGARRQLVERVGVDEPVCGICIAVCPKGRQPGASARAGQARRTRRPPR